MDWDKIEQLLNVCELSRQYGDRLRPIYDRAMSELMLAIERREANTEVEMPTTEIVDRRL
jgi:hypothetical protein